MYEFMCVCERELWTRNVNTVGERNARDEKMRLGAAAFLREAGATVRPHSPTNQGTMWRFVRVTYTG